VYWNVITKNQSTFQEHLFERIVAAKHKDDFSPFDIYQYIDTSIEYLNSNEPKSLSIQKEFGKEKNFSILLAYFIGYLVKNKSFIINNAGEPRNNFALFVLISYLAKDSVEKSKLGRFEQHYSGLPDGSIQEQFDYFRQIHFDLLMDYVKMFFDIEIERFLCFQE
jgi:hypothetical protein